MKAGALDKRVDLLRRRTGTDSVGQPPREYDRWATVWASVHPTTAKELRAAAQTVNLMDVVVSFRWIAGVRPIDRVRFADGRIADVTSMIEPEFVTELIELHCLYVAEEKHSGDG